MPTYFPIHRYLGLDLGQRTDHSALSVLELAVSPSNDRDPYTMQFLAHHALHLRDLVRFPLGQTYPTIADQVRRYLARPILADYPKTLIVDASGPGLAFLDFFTTSAVPASLIKIIITATGAPHYNNGYYHVSRSHLLSNLATLIQNGALKIAPNLNETGNLIKELRNLQQTLKSAAAHDDLAMATALAAWQANKNNRATLQR